MRADHIIKFHNDHPMMAPQLVGVRLTGGIVAPLNQENILKGVLFLRNWVGQMPAIIKAKKSVAGFKLRKGTDLLVLVTLRNQLYLQSFTDSIIYTLMEENRKGIGSKGLINFGLTEKMAAAKQLGGAGINVELFVKGQIKESRGLFFQSSLLIPSR